MTENPLITTLKDIQSWMPKNRCWGVRLDSSGELYFFYHPYGCENEYSCNEKAIEDWKQRILKWEKSK